MVKIKHAPAGYIASLYRDPGTPGFCGDCPDWLGCMGSWKSSSELAVSSLEQDIPKQLAKLKKKVERLRRQIKEAEELATAIAGANRNQVVE